MPSFDAVSKVDWSEVQNAFQQAEREIQQRFDFRGTGAVLERQDKAFLVRASSEERVRAVVDVFEQKLVRRKVSLRHLDVGKCEPGHMGAVKLRIDVKEGIEREKAKEIVKLLKDAKLKVQAAMQEDTVRVTGKQRDDLQTAITALKAADLDIELQFINFRD